MRLSDEKINHLAHRIADRLAESERLELVKERNEARLRIQQVITEELRLDDRVDKRVREQIESYARHIPEGSRDWDIEYERLYEKEMSRLRGVGSREQGGWRRE